MKRHDIVKLVDLLSFLGLSFLISTGSLLRFTLPPRSGAANIWGLTRHEWGDIHFYVSVIFLVLMSVHLFLHLTFIKSAILGRASRELKYRLAIGFISFIVLIGGVFSPLLSPVENQGERGGLKKSMN